MRIRYAAVAGAITLAVLTACSSGGSDVKTEPTKKPTSGKPAEPTAEPMPTPTEEAATVGDTITLEGQEDGEEVEVTLVKWVDPAKSADEFVVPEKGRRWVAGQFRLHNTGEAAYADSPGNGAQVADTDGQRFQTTYTGGITAGPEMTSDLKMKTGDTGLGWIVFDVPQASKITKVQFALNSGFADQTGQWNVP